jgi:hypothetical protein
MKTRGGSFQREQIAYAKTQRQKGKFEKKPF